VIKEITEYLGRDREKYKEFLTEMKKYHEHKDKRHLKAFYDNEYYQRIYKGTPNARLDRKFKIITRLMKLKQGETVLDIGCATKWLKPYITQYGATYVGLDMSKNFRPDVVADAQVLPIKNRVFDWVVLADVIEHVPNPQNVITETVRVAKGIAAVVPNLYHLNSLTFLPSSPYDGHLNKMTPKRWNKMLEDNGVRILATRGFMYTPSVSFYSIKLLEAIDLVFGTKPFLLINDLLDPLISERAPGKYLGQEFIIVGETCATNV